jgi:hypothetical protein
MGVVADGDEAGFLRMRTGGGNALDQFDARGWRHASVLSLRVNHSSAGSG